MACENSGRGTVGIIKLTSLGKVVTYTVTALAKGMILASINVQHHFYNYEHRIS